MSDSLLYEKMDLFYLGREVDTETGATSILPFLYKNKHLTTHAAILGMTGSGKTGLGVCLLEEAAMDRLPAIVIDPKGDMGNLLLSFPDLQPDDFLPWIDDTKAEQQEISREDLAQRTAETWEKGIGSWDQDKERIRKMRSGAEFTVYTPGSESGRPVSVLDSLDAPEQEVLADNDTAASLVNATVSSVLGLIGMKADPLKSREHILLSSIVLHHWSEGTDLSIEELISSVVNPPFDSVGVFPLESFFPQPKRMELALQLNNILASPAFSGWTKGEPLRVESLLYTSAGKPRISIFSIAHLSEPERMFFVTMLLGRLVNWMRRQEGSSGLRCILYMDEIFGYFPPLGNPPSKKPMLMLLKQARAFGVGVVLATQNPVDLDYKGLSNIGTWFIGRLQTRQDQDRVLHGIADSAGSKKKSSMRELLANMRGRTFLMHSAHVDEPVLFETRWVMSYLKGPISLAEVAHLPGMELQEKEAQQNTPSQPAFSTSGNDLQNKTPLLPNSIDQSFVFLPLAIEDVIFSPWLAGEAKVRFFNQSRGIDQLQDVRVRIPLNPSVSADFSWDNSTLNSVQIEQLSQKPPSTGKFRALPAWFLKMKNLKSAEKKFSDYLYHTKELPLLRVLSLKLESVPGEEKGQFHQRVVDCLREKKEEAVGKLEERYRRKQKVLERRLEKAYDRIEKEKGDVKARGIDAALSFGLAVFGAVFGRKALSVSTASKSAQGMRSAGKVMKEKEDVRRASEEAGRVEEEVSMLAQELQDKIAAVADKYDPDQYPLESFSITPRRTDIFDVKVSLQWEPELDLPPLK